MVRVLTAVAILVTMPAAVATSSFAAKNTKPKEIVVVGSTLKKKSTSPHRVPYKSYRDRMGFGNVTR